MKPAPFQYHRAVSVDDAVTALATLPDAKLIAGGQSLIPLMNFRMSRPQTLVDISHLDNLASVTLSDGVLVLGALLPHQRLCEDALIREQVPVLAEAAQHIGHWAIRTRGTLGGSLAHADPAAELPAAMVALDAEFVLRNVRGTRTVAARDFYLGFLTTDLAADEMLSEVRIPVPPQGWYGFAEVARRAGDFALAGAYVQVRDDGGGSVTWFGIGGGPERREFESVPEDAAALWRELLADVDVTDDDDYRRHLGVLVADWAYRRAQGEAQR